MSALKKTVTLKLSSVRVPGGALKGLDQGVVDGIAAGYERGEETPPVAIRPDKTLLWGRHRFAAHKKAGRKEIRADVMAFATPDAEEAAVIAENLQRKHLSRDERDDLIARYLRLVGVTAQPSATTELTQPQLGQMSQSESRHEPAAKVHRERKAKVKEAAKLGGVSTKTVERIAAREEVKLEPPAPPVEPAPPPPCVESFGLQVPASVDGRARRVQAAVDEADKHLRALARIVNALEESGVPAKHAQKARLVMEDAAALIRGVRAEALCPYCKGVVKVADCYFCQGAGFADAERMRKSIPDELLRTGAEAQVADGTGKFRLLTAPSTPPAPAEIRGRIRLVDENDKPIEVPDEDPPADEEIPF